MDALTWGESYIQGVRIWRLTTAEKWAKIERARDGLCEAVLCDRSTTHIERHTFPTLEAAKLWCELKLGHGYDYMA